MKHALEIAVAAVIIILAAVFLAQNAGMQEASGEEAWGGADSEAAELIEASGYEPWIDPIWKPPSGEIESLLFAMQAAIGALVIGYFFGYWKGSRKAA
ncbi:MAG: energy-coupling factor ABC transporter substrate-binding protein [Methanomicrobiaceae archaeon]|uniref:Additional substrate-specific component cbin of cobalt ecf transporter n=1 Tax=hydrocarbon metagenome TaxID=938273 RepID=A0A0W8FII7_9ZZZZ|nr:energy-coupling factor ABC transporter substrate-binding protein [Methanomicrobiaceae archaeon]